MLLWKFVLWRHRLKMKKKQEMLVVVAGRGCRSIGNTPLRLSTFRLLQVRLVYYAFYNFAFYNFAWNVIVRHLVYLTSVFHNVSNLCTVILDFIPGVLCWWTSTECYARFLEGSDGRRVDFRCDQGTSCGANAAVLCFPCDNTFWGGGSDGILGSHVAILA